MWPFTKKNQHQLVTVVITDHFVACTWFKKDSVSKQVAIQGYKKVFLKNNTTTVFLQVVIHSFLKMYILDNAFIAIALQGEGINCHYLALTDLNTHSTTSDLFDDHIWKKKYTYLYPVQTNSYFFCLQAIKHSVLFQYNLMSLRGCFNTIALTTNTMALLCLYTYIKAESFRQAQMAIDMDSCNNVIEEYFTRDTLTQLIRNDITFVDQSDVLPLLISVGLFVHYKGQM